VKQIKPILAEKCYSCHGALKQEAELTIQFRLAFSIRLGGSHENANANANANSSTRIIRFPIALIVHRISPPQRLR